MRNIFLKKTYAKFIWTLFSESKLTISLDQNSEILCGLLLLYVQIEVYQNLLLPHNFFFFFKKRSGTRTSVPSFISAWFFHYVNSVQMRSFYGPYFPVFGLNADIYTINHRIQSEYREIRTRKNSVFGHISRSVQKYHAPRCTLFTD